MKKILFLILPLFFFLFLAKPSFAQTTGGLYFASENQTTHFIPDTTKQQTIILRPFTRIILQPNTFSDKSVIMLAVPGRWDTIKSTFLPNNQSPIISYRLLFQNPQGVLVLPNKPINIEAYNNFTGTKTFYYPLDISLNKDTLNQKQLPGPILAKVTLPTSDNAFIIAIDKIVDKNSQIFSVGTNNASTPPPVAKGLNQTSLKQIAIVAVVVIVVAVVLYLYYLKKKPKKIRKVEGPKKIIVGGK